MLYQKYKEYKGENEELSEKLDNNYKSTYNDLLNHLKSLGVTDSKTKYLIDELIEDKEHLDAYLAVKISRV